MFEAVVLSIGILIFLLTWFYPLPYGRFSLQYDTFDQIIPNRYFIALINLPVLIVLCWYAQNLKPLGLALYIFLWVHFFTRAVLVPCISGFIYTTDSKRVSLILTMLLITYNVFVGLTLGGTCQDIDGAFGSWSDVPLFVGAGTCLLLNAYYDCRVNYLRCHGEVEMGNHLYLTEKSLMEKFQLMFALGITSPNYFFEIIEWLLIFLATQRVETFVYFISTMLILWSRGLQINLSFDTIINN